MTDTKVIITPDEKIIVVGDVPESTAALISELGVVVLHDLNDLVAVNSADLSDQLLDVHRQLPSYVIERIAFDTAPICEDLRSHDRQMPNSYGPQRHKRW